MGLFFLIRDGQAKSSSVLAAARICERMGFGPPDILTADKLVVYVYPKRGQTRPNTIKFACGDFIAACGTFVFRGMIGQAALKAFYEQFNGDFSLLEEAICSFAIVIRKAGCVHVAGDRFGCYHVFIDRSGTIVSSSFLVTASVL